MLKAHCLVAQGVELFRHPHEALKTWAGYPLAGALGDVLSQDNPPTFEEAQATREVLSVRGRISDPDSLDYLRDSIGVLAGLLDLGGVAIIDPQMLSLFDAAQWRQRYVVTGGAPPRQHVLILVNPDEDGGQWVHTRGMRKFARPDLSVRQVPQADIERAGAMCQKLADLQALGLSIEDGQTLDVHGVPGNLIARTGGDMEDPRFNNTHIELLWNESAP